ncbi:intradiol ring-cleavage dioxygenase [Streptomyces sp. NBC_01012]|uniref:intradiol ring-cleavage dioxygenase n=1 Tax=Streptomyces sp. NBC_01012 TaxID=2903717 RepID=UPI00386A20E4|nr:intradiol ring-cleavage dioxygenase [Streptomyces sp. NBC_01012]
MTTTPITPHDEPDNSAVSHILSRRRLFALGGAVALTGIGAAGHATARSAAAGTETLSSARAAAVAADACMQLTSESIEGPYYVDYELFREDVVEDRTGIPFTLTLRVVDTETCEPIPDSAIEIWHCDASGVYSGFTDAGNGGGGGGGGGVSAQGVPTDDLTWLRGIQMTDDEGHVTFRTVFPGWYTGRAVHIHTKVHTGGTRTSDGYEGGRTCHTGQFYFEEDAVIATEGISPYAENTVTRVTLDEDMLYPGTGTVGGLLDLTYDPEDIEQGVTGSITMAVDPQATNEG